MRQERGLCFCRGGRGGHFLGPGDVVVFRGKETKDRRTGGMLSFDLVEHNIKLLTALVLNNDQKRKVSPFDL